MGEDEGFAAFGWEGVDKRAHVDPLGPDACVARVGGTGVFVFDDGFAGACHVVSDVVDPDTSGKR